MSERVDIEGIMSEIRGAAREIEPPRRGDSLGEASPVEQTLELRRTLTELTDCCDLYATRGMPPTRFWIPRPVRWFLVRAVRYFLNWQTHWNLTAARALDEMLRSLQRLERWTQSKSAVVEGRLARSDAARDAAFSRRLRFDASEEDVRDHLAADVHAFARAFADDPSLLEAGGAVLELHCGRGETLRLLREAGIPGQGVDPSAEMIRICRENRLDVVETEVLAYLERVAAASVPGIICRPSVERSSSDENARLFELVARSLRPGALCLFATANPEDSFIQLAESLGLEVLDVHDSSPGSGDQQLKLLPGDDASIRILNENLMRLNHLLFGPKAYAIVCRKSRAAQRSRSEGS